MRYINALLNNIGIKIISLAMAVILWFVISGEKTSEVGFPVPLELQNVPPGIEIVGGVPETIKVRVRASAAIVRQLDRQDLSVQIDMSEAAPGERIYQLAESAVKRPFGVSVVKISPTTITLALEKTERVAIPIEVKTSGYPAREFEVKSISCTPGKVVVAGPRSKLKIMPNAYTETISIEGEKTGIVKTVSIGIDEPLVRIDDEQKATVIIEIGERRKTKTIREVRIEHHKAGRRIFPDRVRVVIEGPVSEVDAFEPEMMQAGIEENERAGGAKARVVVDIKKKGGNVVVKKVEPASVVVR